MATPFEKILSGETPARVLLRTSRVAAILADRPIQPGHCVVFPAQFVDGWRDASPELLGELFEAARRVAAAIDREVVCRRVAIAIVGVQVAHLHLHLVPVNEPAELDFGAAAEAPPTELNALAAKLTAHLGEV